jgi:outer membrane protein assembly factor BamB
MRLSLLGSVAVVASALISTHGLIAADFPHWRGPTRSDIVNEPSGWSNGKWLTDKPAWTANVGNGASSPLVVDGKVYTLGWSNGKDTLRCLSLREGKELWSADYRSPEHPRFHMGDEGLYNGATSTPEYDPETKYLYTLGCDGDLNCWDTQAKGKIVWGLNLYAEYKTERRPKLTRAPQRDYGYTSSPYIHSPWLLVEVGSAKGSLVAFDKKNGKQVWLSEIKDEAGHTGGPTPITIDKIPCVAVLTQRNLVVIRLDAGNEGTTLATYPWVTDFANSIASPAVNDDCVLLTAAYNHNAMVKLKITSKRAEKLWQKPYPSKVCTPVIHQGSIYVAWQKVRCIDWETGDLKWEGGSFADPGSCLIASDDRLIVWGQRGKLALIETAKRSPKKYEELALRDGVFKELAWPHVVLADGRLLVRDRVGNLACFNQGVLP